MGHDSVQEMQPETLRGNYDQKGLRQSFVAGTLELVVEVCKQQPLAGHGSTTYPKSGPLGWANPFVHDVAMRACRQGTVNRDSLSGAPYGQDWWQMVVRLSPERRD